MLIGSHNHIVDEKGRLFMPAKFREDLGEQFILARGLSEFLFVYSKDEWMALSGKLRALPITNKKAQYVMRRLYSSAVEREPDKQGRILLPAELREYAGINKDAVVIGMENRVEIWSKENWEAYESAGDGEYEEALESLGELGI